MAFPQQSCGAPGRLFINHLHQRANLTRITGYDDRQVILTQHEKSPPGNLRDLLESTFRKKSTRWAVPDCGLSAAHRYSVEFEDNSSVFVKAATDEQTEQWLRSEHLVLSSARYNFMPKVIEWIDKPGLRPVLISEDLSRAYWPASHAGVVWRKGDFDLLFDGIKELSTSDPPMDLPALQNRRTAFWPKIAEDPESFIRLKLCSEAWLRKAIDALIEAERSADVTGSCFVHGDLRSDNICFDGAQVMFVDWSHAARGSRAHDPATLLPTLHLEGGPAPYEIMPDGGSEAALACAGHIMRIARNRSIPEWLFAVFKKLIAIELEWAGNCLGLEEPDGIKWNAI